MEVSSYKWIVELAEHKHSYLPQLKLVHLIEGSEQYQFPTEAWHPPLSVETVFGDADIELKVAVMVEHTLPS